MKDKESKRFPLKLESSFSTDIDYCVFHTKSASKHQYILDALKEKVAKDLKLLKDKIAQ